MEELIWGIFGEEDAETVASHFVVPAAVARCSAAF